MFDALFNSKRILSRNRHPWIDYARGITIILVSFRHFFSGVMPTEHAVENYPLLSYINIFFFSFRMPLFFIVSGMFFRLSLRDKGFANFTRNRFQTIFYPLIVWGIIHVSLQLIFADYVNANRQPSDYLRLLYQPRSVEQFWYLNALFFVSLLYVLVAHYAKFNAIRQLVLGVVLYAVAGYLHGNNIEVGFVTDVCFFYLFYAVGDLVSKFMLDAKNIKKIASWKTLLLLLPVFLILQHYFTTLNLEHSNDYFVQNYHPVLYALAAVVGGAFVLCVSFLLQQSNRFRFLRVVGYHSLYIYVANLMVTASARVVMTRIFHLENMYLMLVLGTAAGVIVPIILYNLAQKLGLWWLYTLRRPLKPAVAPAPAAATKNTADKPRLSSASTK